MKTRYNLLHIQWYVLFQLPFLQEILSTTCITPLQQSGECVQIRNCPSLLNILRTKGEAAGDFLRRSVCQYEGKNPIVCCPAKFNDNNNNGNINPDTNKETQHLFDKYNSLHPPQCGFSNISYSRVVGGVPAEVGDWPWIAALGYQFKKSSENIKWLCGGSLVSSKHVLTAGHCVYNRPDLILVRLGDLDLFSNTDNVQPLDVLIEKYILHPEYSATTYTNDIAILKLKDNIPFSALIHPICLPLADDIRKRDFARTFPFIAGWGSIYFNGPSSSHLQELQIPIVDTYQCQKAFKQFKTSTIDERTICAGYARGGKDACQGDSGGPLMFPKETTFYLIGIVSFGFRCAEPGFPGVYTRITAFLDFIQTNMT
ncbi:venom serine protease Bi-VSP-like [Leptopilina boulardi]|uniref:venom serine protease Bi-VSP-like n=1 Tax=Leptopilina boulardi TaxID=63433 RepID=UPI0021F54B86|nr:venom serine protease Bi-VSP-like [Leptopilina boulardi]XP_051173405.1 venom serine protease Bi-VSP-like [Leptopilina boulardi]